MMQAIHAPLAKVPLRCSTPCLPPTRSPHPWPPLHWTVSGHLIWRGRAAIQHTANSLRAEGKISEDQYQVFLDEQDKFNEALKDWYECQRYRHALAYFNRDPGNFGTRYRHPIRPEFCEVTFELHKMLIRYEHHPCTMIRTFDIDEALFWNPIRVNRAYQTLMDQWSFKGGHWQPSRHKSYDENVAELRYYMRTVTSFQAIHDHFERLYTEMTARKRKRERMMIDGETDNDEE